MRTILSAVLLATLAVTAVGCSGRGEKDEYKGDDVPVSAVTTTG